MSEKWDINLRDLLKLLPYSQNLLHDYGDEEIAADVAVVCSTTGFKKPEAIVSLGVVVKDYGEILELPASNPDIEGQVFVRPHDRFKRVSAKSRKGFICTLYYVLLVLVLMRFLYVCLYC